VIARDGPQSSAGAQSSKRDAIGAAWALAPLTAVPSAVGNRALARLLAARPAPTSAGQRGIARGAYTSKPSGPKHRKAEPERGAKQPNRPIVEPTDERERAIEQHVKAYNRARFYHGTRVKPWDEETKKKLSNIEKVGLDPSYGGTGASARVQGEGFVGKSVNKVHVTPDRATGEYYADADPRGLLRPLLPRDRTLAIDFDQPGSSGVDLLLAYLELGRERDSALPEKKRKAPKPLRSEEKDQLILTLGRERYRALPEGDKVVRSADPQTQPALFDFEALSERERIKGLGREAYEAQQHILELGREAYLELPQEQRNTWVRPGALTTGEVIPGENIIFRDDVELTPRQLRIIGQHYPQPETDVEVLRRNHQEARRQRRVSVGPLPGAPTSSASSSDIPPVSMPFDVHLETGDRQVRGHAQPTTTSGVPNAPTSSPMSGGRRK
jgi:hypothetical protein